MITLIICAAVAIVVMFSFGFVLGYKTGTTESAEELLEEIERYLKRSNYLTKE